MDHTAFVLAAGLGTRLQPLTWKRPKALVPVCGTPMLDIALAGCAAAGHRRVVVNAFHHADLLAAHIRKRERAPGVTVVDEPELLGTGGGLRAARHLMAPRFVVVNADVLHDVDLVGLLAAVPAGGAAMALRPHAPDAERYGAVLMDSEGVVVRLSHVGEIPAQGEVVQGTHFTGVHALDRSLLDAVPDGPQCIVRTAYRGALPARALRGVLHRGTWLDVGDPAAYLAANLAVLCTTMSVPHDVGAGAAYMRGPRGERGRAPSGVTIEGSVWIGVGASVEPGAVLRDTVVGAGAAISSQTRMTRCVVWDGREVGGGTWSDAIFHDGGYLPLGGA
jgi:mannose-1-phosphate guanylyltransferase